MKYDLWKKQYISLAAHRLVRSLMLLGLTTAVMFPRQLWPVLIIIPLIWVARRISCLAGIWIVLLLTVCVLTPSFSGKGFALSWVLLPLTAGNVLGIVGKTKPWRLISWIFLLGLPACILALIQWTLQVPIPPGWLAGSEQWLIPTRVVGHFGNPNVLAGFLLFLQPLGWVMALESSSRIWRGFIVAALLLQTVVLVLTFSYAAWFILLGEAILFIWSSPLKSNRIVLVCGLFLLLACIVLGWGIVGGTADYRVQIWKASWETFREHIFGTGAGGFGIYYPMARGAVRADHAHSLYLQVLVEFGVVGFSALLVMGFNIARRISSKNSRWRQAILSALVGQFAWGFVEYIWAIPVMTLLFWLGEGVTEKLE
jgi:putative inorganic carbon (HCO3(-)) transporter